MTRTTAGTIVALVGAVLLVIALASSRWTIVGYGQDAVEDNVAGLWSIGGVVAWSTWAAGFALVLLALPMIVTRARSVCAGGIAIACVALVGASWVAIEASAKVHVGPVVITWSLGAAGMLAAAMLLMAPADGTPAPPPPHDGRRLVYDAAGVLVAVEHYEGGVLRRTDRVGADGLTASEP